jgi:Predicted dehydrogenases and related proteins
MEAHMLKIGMIGSESTHASTFSSLANVPDANGRYLFGDVRVTEIYGENPERTGLVAETDRIAHIVKTPEEMIGRVDAVMIVFRNGDLHYRHALPFIEAGIPAWVDKPFAVDYGDAVRLARAARQKGTPLAGGSNCKFSDDVLALKGQFERIRKDGRIISAGFNFPCDIASEYGGVYFYASHAADILYTIFGTEARSVKTDVHCGNLVALVKYPEFTVTINFADVCAYHGILYTSAGVVTQPIDISAIYEKAFAHFLNVIRCRKMPENYEHLLFPVRFLNALEQSIRIGGGEVRIAPKDAAEG